MICKITCLKHSTIRKWSIRRVKAQPSRHVWNSYRWTQPVRIIRHLTTQARKVFLIRVCWKLIWWMISHAVWTCCKRATIKRTKRTDWWRNRLSRISTLRICPRWQMTSRPCLRSRSTKTNGWCKYRTSSKKKWTRRTWWWACLKTSTTTTTVNKATRKAPPIQEPGNLVHLQPPIICSSKLAIIAVKALNSGKRP